MKKEIISIINNSIITACTIFATICMFANIHFMPSKFALETQGLSNFKYFTVDSNLLIGAVCFIFAICEILKLKKKIKEIPKWLYILKHVATAGIALTFFTTCLFLGPTIDTGFFSLYTNANLFYHFIIPVLAMLGYILFDKYDSNYKQCLYCLIPMVIYSFYYVPNVLLHLVDGKTALAYDFYGFFHGNPNSIFVFYPLMLSVVYVIAVVLYTLNKKILKK